MINERSQPRDVLTRVTWVAYFDAVNSVANERLDSLPCSGLPRMREDGETTGAMNECDRVDDGKPILRDVAWTAIAEITIEGVAKVDRPALGDHGSRDVRPADRATGRLL